MATKTQAVEVHEDGLLVKEMEARDELLVEASDLAVEDERRCRQPADGFGDLRETGRVRYPNTYHRPRREATGGD